MITQIEAADAQMRRSGLKEAWFADVDTGVLGVSGEANGELFAQLSALSKFRDLNAVSLLHGGRFSPVIAYL